MKDSEKVISEFTGISRPELRAIAEQVKANHARLDECPWHEFIVKPGEEGKVMGKRYVCTVCGGEVDSHAYYWHQDGRRARP